MHRRSVLKTLAGATAAAGLASGRLVAAGAAAGERGTGPDIFFNQVGYGPAGAKMATVRGAASGQTSFRVRNASDNRVVFEGSLSSPRLDAASGDLVQQASFTGLRQPGSYRLEVGGQGSDQFPVADHVYAAALRSVVRGYTGQRCGCAVDLGGGFRHGACHLTGAYGPSTGRSGALPNRGGWHDAGDYGRYIVNSGITCGTLLWAWELFPEALRPLDLGVAKQRGNLPDFLAEVLWNLRWMLQLQEGDGGVFHKQTSDRFAPFVLPEQDRSVSNVTGTGAAPYKSTAATADFAAVMAIAARCFRPYDRALAAQFLAAARSAWAWATAHPHVPFGNPPGVLTGDYGDLHLNDELVWAAAELWRSTGEPAFEQAFRQGLPRLDDLRIEAPSWSDVFSLACWTYALAPAGGNPATVAAVKQRTQAAARVLVQRSGSNGYGNTLAPEDYVWGSNGVAGNQSLLLLVANHFEPSAEVVVAALANLHYMLGRNCFGISWVTQLGTRPLMHPHHRPSAADGIVDPWPGLLSGGPNRRPADPVARTLPAAPPMRMWVDDTGAYSMNEVAINWNAPLVFLLAFANSRAS